MLQSPSPSPSCSARKRAASLAIALLCLAGCGDAQPGGNAAATVTAGPAPASAPPDDLFTFAAGAQFIVKPADTAGFDFKSDPVNLIDESPLTSWRDAVSKGPAVLVLELPESASLTRLVFDDAGLAQPRDSVKAIKVEVSDSTAVAGYRAVLATELTPTRDGQSFTLADKPIGRWVRLTITSNHGGDHFALTGFHGFGQKLTQGSTIANVSGTYEGHSGWGKVRLKQEGTRVVGCYEDRDGVIAGGIDGRLLKATMIETDDGDGSQQRSIALFSFLDNRILGLTHREGSGLNAGYDAAYGGEKISDDSGDCPHIPGWRTDAAKSQLADELAIHGRARLDGINFDVNEATIQPKARQLLDKVARVLKDNEAWQVTLEVHGDNLGDAAFNKALSGRRAAAVAAYLVGTGIPATRLSSVGFGSERPVASNDSQGGRAQNRRVEIVKR